jgi:ribosomal protein L7/L12
MNLIDTIRGLRCATPGDTISQELHRSFQENLKTIQVDFNKLRAALDEAETYKELALQDKVAEIIALALGEMTRNYSDIDMLIKQNKYIEAIKEFRTRTGCGLREAKDAIDIRKKELCI